VALENFPLTTLAERLSQGEGWTRRQWAEARLAQRFARRVPASASQALTAALSAADLYVADYTSTCTTRSRRAASGSSRRASGPSRTGTCGTS
jgi:hypothetical protein